MVPWFRLRVLVALAFAVSSVAIFAAPAAAGTVLTACTGTCGFWQVYDASTVQRGANCVYQNGGSYQLKDITVRPPLMHGNYPNKTKVGWRLRVHRSR
jgi:hypothetical protein